MRTNAFSTSASSKLIRFAIDKEHYRRIEVEPGVTICHLYPTLTSWVGREAPDDVNPRSHEDQALTGAVPKAIEQTIRENPEDFYLANRGETILAQSVSFDPDKQFIEILLTDHSGDTARHGVADGGTTDGMIAKEQRQVAKDRGIDDFRNLTVDQIPDYLRTARVHLEVIVGLEDRDRIGRLVQGRNTSRQVKPWTIADFKGTFDWIKEILDNSRFRGKIGYEENAGAPVNILEVLAILTLFHPMYDSKGKAPTIAYSSKGRMDKRLTDATAAPGYSALAPILTDILRLHDHVYANFHSTYKKAVPGGKLGRRGKTEDRVFPKNPKPLPLTGVVADYHIPTGVLYPLLASLRALVRFPKETETNEACWRIDPFVFFDNNGGELMENLISQLEVLQNNPQTMGKTKTVYTALHDRARLLVADAERLANGDCNGAVLLSGRDEPVSADPQTDPQRDSQTDLGTDSRRDAQKHPLKQGTGSDAGISSKEQMRIALQEIDRQGGSAPIHDIIGALESVMNSRGFTLSYQGKQSFRHIINTDAVNLGYLHPYAEKEAWCITEKGRLFIRNGTV